MGRPDWYLSSHHAVHLTSIPIRKAIFTPFGATHLSDFTDNVLATGSEIRVILEQDFDLRVGPFDATYLFLSCRC